MPHAYVLHHRIRLEATTLVVSTNGKERRFDWSNPKITGLRTLGLWQKSDGYSIDLRDLIEMPSEPDIAEMLETHQRIEAIV